ncbi:MAG: aspartate kinase [Oscillospiraceae bacterium]|nr:aspartate kinase [Oscillospiraceae bacterium]
MVIYMTDIIVNENQSIVTFNNVAASYENSFICGILERAAKSEISIDMISQAPATSERISFGFTFYDDDLTKLLSIINSCQLSEANCKPLVNSGNVKVTVKSREMIDNAGFAEKVFAVLRNINCVPLLITTGIDEISLLVQGSAGNDLAKALSETF